MRWLERRAPPVLVAPRAVRSRGHVLSVPNNEMDLVAKAWSAGRSSAESDPSQHRALKFVQPMFLRSSDAIHYLWTLDEPFGTDERGHVEVLRDVARSVYALGWGIDMAFADATLVTAEDMVAIQGERWSPSSENESGLWVPMPGTLDGVLARHELFLARLASGSFVPPPPLSAYRKVAYHRATDVRGIPWTAFILTRVDGNGMRAFDTSRRALAVAGMLRGATARAATDTGWPHQDVATMVLGHSLADDVQRSGASRFAYFPLPTVEGGPGRAGRIGDVRRVMVATFCADTRERIAWVERSLAGRELLADGGVPVAVLVPLPTTDGVVRRYTRPSDTWATVTPVVLPGHDDPRRYRRRLGRAGEGSERLIQVMARRTDKLLRTAIAQAGLPEELARYALVEWRPMGFLPGTEPAGRYGVPDHLRRLPRLHVKVRWRDAEGQPVRVPGPICFGGGRFYGIGLFVALTEGSS
jgi:CRISPR-associated protein Csb2